MSGSISEIAKKTRLSPRTIRYILNARRTDLFKVETRELVERVAAEVGYRPNAAARAMRNGKFCSIGLLQSTSLSNSNLSPYTLLGIEQRLLERQQRLMVGMVSEESFLTPGQIPPILREWSADGLLLLFTTTVPAMLKEAIAAHPVPAVWLNNKLEHDAIYYDDHAAAHHATRELIAVGHTRIAFVTFCLSDHYSFRDRAAGYRDAMIEAGLPPRLQLPEAASAAASVPTDRAGMARSILYGSNRPTAIITYGGNDEITPLIIAAVQFGLRVPGDLALLGFHDGKITDSGIDIATMRLPTHQAGLRAVELLMAKIDAGASVKRVLSTALQLSLDRGATLTPPVC